ncbi:MAG: shikimate kinase [Gammaproteobacteria bacterium]|nr:shikimate kinase [Gammaproteobacteria bacterium]
MKASAGIFLVGPMGAGKSTIGRVLAARLGREFCDCDTEIEKRTGASIPLIFAVEGEPGFRRWESLVLADLVLRPKIVLATGGGAVLAAANRDLLKAHGCVVYLQAGTDTLWERVHRDRGRPLLQAEDPRARVEALAAARDPLYREVADLIVSTDHRAPPAVARTIVSGLRTLVRAHTDA